MRFLFCTSARPGHFGPMVPIARACLDSGHEVAVAAPVSFSEAVTRVGLHHLPFPDAPPDQMGTVFGRLAQMSVAEANQTVLGEVFARLEAQAALPSVTSTIAQWRPHVVVRDPMEFASLVAAEAAQLPQVQVAIGMGGLDSTLLSVLEAPLAELSERAGLPASRAGDALRSCGTLTSVPASLDGQGLWAAAAETQEPSPSQVWRYREDTTTPAERPLPEWGDPAAPLVYVSFGSLTGLFGHISAVYAQTVAALADLPIRVLMTTGEAFDPAQLGSVAANARVERWRPQAEVMPHAAAVVSHGGFGTTMIALKAGVPQVLAPLYSADQFVNAERVADAGAGLRVLGLPGAEGDLAVAVQQLLEDLTYRRQAEALAADIRALPDIRTCVDVLNDLAGTLIRSP